jgi:hypothetical protein
MARRGRPSKTDDDDKTDQHIIMQLRKVAILGAGKQVEFRNGDVASITPALAVKILRIYNDMPRPTDKAVFQDEISFSLENFLQYG